MVLHMGCTVFAWLRKAMGFSTNLHQLFVGLDRDGKKWLILEDVVFLDRWKPPAYLLAKPNNKAQLLTDMKNS
eukprot:822430-Amphidinium_carterae.1